MRDDDECHLFKIAKFPEAGHDFAASCLVECAGWLVAQNHSGAQQQCPCDGDALFLAAGELVWHGIGSVAHAKPFHEFACVIDNAGVIGILSAECGRQANIFEARHVIEQIEVLKDEANHFASKAAEHGIG